MFGGLWQPPPKVHFSTRASVLAMLGRLLMPLLEGREAERVTPKTHQQQGQQTKLCVSSFLDHFVLLLEREKERERERERERTDEKTALSEENTIS